MSQRITISQFHPHAAPGDAITNQMIFIRDSLAEAGIGGRIFAQTIRDGIRDEVSVFDGSRAGRSQAWDSDLLLVHHSQFNPLLPRLMKLEIPKAIVYHNITPAHFFNHDPLVRDLCRRGRQQLRQFKNHTVAAFADSRYNAAELESVGLKNIQWLPLFDLPSRLKSPARKATGQRSKRGSQILFVGRIAPHKNQARLVETLYFLKKLRPGSRLILVGSEEPVYARYVKDLVQVLQLKGAVNFAGKVSDNDLRDLYLSSDAFLCTSLHEGFGIPIVEAMALGLPVFSFNHAALSETLGEAGVHLQTDEPDKIASVLSTCLENSEAMSFILRSQERRIKELSRIENKETVVERLRQTVNQLRRSPSQVKGTARKPNFLRFRKSPSPPEARP